MNSTIAEKPGNPWNLKDNISYLTWRNRKLSDPLALDKALDPVEIRHLDRPSDAEKSELISRCRRANAAVYAAQHMPDDSLETQECLRHFANQMGLDIAEKHRSAGQNGIVALQISHAQDKRGYIPYSKRPMNWHTDGYYNSPDEKIRAMVLHCAHPADDGGVNQFLDPEIAYIRLRDENPGYIDALMHPQAMVIPENREANGKLRPVSVGPVFEINGQSGKLEMRYTARTRSIQWRDDPVTRQATEFLTQLLQTGDPFMQTLKLQAGQGVLCNNSLHNRTGFDPDQSDDSKRLIYRIRFHNRVKGT